MTASGSTHRRFRGGKDRQDPSPRQLIASSGYKTPQSLAVVIVLLTLEILLQADACLDTFGADRLDNRFEFLTRLRRLQLSL